MEYDPAHKTSSVTSTSSNASSIWDPLPSLYYNTTGRAESVSSVYDDLPEPGPFEEEDYSLQQQKAMMMTLINDNNVSQDDPSAFTDFLDSFLCIKEEDQAMIMSHEEPSSPPPPLNVVSHGKKRPYEDTVVVVQEEEEEGTQQNDLQLSTTTKLNRDILSIDQKRANHIASEQKRRNTIRGGFKELTELIPTLKNINHSKSTILFKSVDYIKQLDKRNKSLKDRLNILQARVQQKKQQSQSQLPPNTIAALLVHKNQQKQLELLQEQLRVQQALLSKHNVFTTVSNNYYHSISIPAMDDTPTTSTTTSPTLPHASLPSSFVHNHCILSSSSNITNALVIPALDDNHWQHSNAPSFTIPADSNNYYHPPERLLSSGKLDHLK